MFHCVCFKLSKLEEELTTKFEKENQSRLKALQSKHDESIESITTQRDLFQQELNKTKSKVLSCLVMRFNRTEKCCVITVV